MRPENAPSSNPVWIDTDLGLDVDDLMALIVARATWGERIVGISTNHYGPLEKARLSHAIFAALGQRSVPVFAGAGTPLGDEAAFRQRYTRWPPQFGGIYTEMGRATRQALGDTAVDSAPVRRDAVQALIKAATRHAGRLEVVVLGPLTNIAAAMARDPSWARKVKRLIVMGGWYRRSDGTIKRPSYNTLMDLAAARVVFGHPQLELLLVNSNALKDVRLRESDFTRLSAAGCRRPVGRALAGEMKRWARWIGNKTGTLALADPITVLVAADPSWIAATRGFVATPHLLPGVHMKHPDAGKLISVQLRQGARQQLITELARPDALRRHIVSILARSCGLP